MLSLLTLLLGGCPLFTLRLSQTGSFPRPLKAAEEEEYLRRWSEGDREARDRLIEHNLRLVAHIARKYYSTDTEDLISIGTIGLIKAVDTWQPGRRSKLGTYAARCIENEILMHLRRTRKLAGEVSLSEMLEGDGDGGLSLMDVIRVEDTMLEDLARGEERTRLRALVEEVLDRRERAVIALRYGLGDGERRTQREVGQAWGISRSYVSRLERGALGKLRRALEREEKV